MAAPTVTRYVFHQKYDIASIVVRRLHLWSSALDQETNEILARGGLFSEPGSVHGVLTSPQEHFYNLVDLSTDLTQCTELLYHTTNEDSPDTGGTPY